MKMPTENEVKDCVNVILSDRPKYTTSLNYAVNYCKAALNMTGSELKVQCLYILCNIPSWRHEQAKHVREVLKAFSK